MFGGMLLSGGTRHQPIQLRVSTRPPYTPHSLITADTRPAAASALYLSNLVLHKLKLYLRACWRRRGGRAGATVPSRCPFKGRMLSGFNLSLDLESFLLFSPTCVHPVHLNSDFSNARSSSRFSCQLSLMAGFTPSFLFVHSYRLYKARLAALQSLLVCCSETKKPITYLFLL